MNVLKALLAILRDIAHLEWISKILQQYPDDPKDPHTIAQFKDAIKQMRTFFGGSPKAVSSF